MGSGLDWRGGRCSRPRASKSMACFPQTKCFAAALFTTRAGVFGLSDWRRCRVAQQAAEGHNRIPLRTSCERISNVADGEPLNCLSIKCSKKRRKRKIRISCEQQVHVSPDDSDSRDGPNGETAGEYSVGDEVRDMTRMDAVDKGWSAAVYDCRNSNGVEDLDGLNRIPSFPPDYQPARQVRLDHIWARLGGRNQMLHHF